MQFDFWCERHLLVYKISAEWCKFLAINFSSSLVHIIQFDNLMRQRRRSIFIFIAIWMHIFHILIFIYLLRITKKKWMNCLLITFSSTSDWRGAHSIAGFSTFLSPEWISSFKMILLKSFTLFVVILCLTQSSLVWYR